MSKEKNVNEVAVQQFQLRKNFPDIFWQRFVSAIQFNGSFASIQKIGDVLGLPTRMDRCYKHHARCRIQIPGAQYDILVEKTQWVVWNKSILSLKINLSVSDLVWDDKLFQSAYRRKETVYDTVEDQPGAK